MMSSVIPARLQFQCGHAALVTLPRVKGETATQRNDRVAREKSAALARQCDFCAPALEVVVNGNNHVVVAEGPSPEPVVAETELVVVVEPAALEEMEVVEAELEEVIAEVVAFETPLVDETPTPESEPEPESETSVNGDLSAPAAAPKRRAPLATRRVRAAEVIRGRRFLVEYRLERVVRAVDIHDALRQASGLGASQLTAITRED
jgi:hypothetical protein